MSKHLETVDEYIAAQPLRPLRAARSTVQLPLNKPYSNELVAQVPAFVVDRTARQVQADA